MNRDHTELEIWIEGKKLVNLAYILTTKLPKELFASAGRIRKTAVSVPLNIAKGYERRTYKDTLPFLQSAGESIHELETQFHLALGHAHVSGKDFEMINKKILLCKKLISGFINYHKKIEYEK